jgi:hypothetical protein
LWSFGPPHQFEFIGSLILRVQSADRRLRRRSAVGRTIARPGFQIGTNLDGPPESAGGSRDCDGCQYGGESRGTEQSHCRHPPLLAVLRPLSRFHRAAASRHARESAYPLQDDTEHTMPPFLCRPITPEIRPNTTFWHGPTPQMARRRCACALRDGVAIVLHAGSAPSRKSNMGSIPIKLGVASGRRGRCKFFRRAMCRRRGARCVAMIS